MNNKSDFTRENLERMATRVSRHGNIRIGRANVQEGVKVGFYNGPNLEVWTNTKSEMYYYLLGRLNASKASQ